MKSAKHYAREFKAKGRTAQALVDVSGFMTAEMWVDLSKAGDASELAIFQYWNRMDERWREFCQIVNKKRQLANPEGFCNHLKEEASEGFAKWMKWRDE